MNKLTRVADQVAEVNLRKGFRRHVLRATKNLNIESLMVLKACDQEIEAAEKLLRRLEIVSTCQILDFPAVECADQLGQSLIDSRHALDWSQTKLAEKVGLDRRDISRYESKQYKQMKLESVMRIAAVLRKALAERRLGLESDDKEPADG